ncbi:hypothetical protein A8F94_01490 [Bacillus sp. FJAT-27225]|uniref:DUF4236 domain-containing protein n=1 Tax=Bacillus sp. FJAT-27225 TaxID=1743144 RepID=UPI00080C3103|nr:DUF4236 domain-containing protein [Bacillus sp. FJAT-27225]OCA90583.1 hypothetical protein A8F94_01490 [Bacillus sp. FJAT-27225]
MALRFRKSFKIAPGVRMTVGKKGVGVSVGGKGLRYSVHSSGRRTTTVGIPGSGVSYSTTSSGKQYKSEAYRRRSELARQERDNRKLQEQEAARRQVEWYENRLLLLKSIHQESDDPVDWEEVSRRKPPFQQGETGPNELEAAKAVADFKPGFFDKLFGRVEKKRALLEAKVTPAKEQDEELYQDWARMTEIAKRIFKGDIDAYFEVIDEFGPLDDLVEFGSGFEFGTDHPQEIHVSVDVNAEKMIPDKQLSLTKTGKLSQKQMTKTLYYDLCQDYVCSCALRIARDMFALLPVKYVFVHAYEEQLNPSTGHIEKLLVLSVRYDRGMVEKLNFEMLDPSDALVNFPHHMKFKKTRGFEEVGPVDY